MAKAVSVVNILTIVFQLLRYGSGIGQLRNCPYLEQISPNPELNRHVICSSIHARFNETGCLMSDYFKAGSTSEVREDSCREVEFKFHDKFNDLRSQCYCVIDQQVPTRYETLRCLYNALEAIYDFMHLECVDEAIAHLRELGLTTTAPSTNMTITTTITRSSETEEKNQSSTSTSSGITTATAPTETIRTSATIPSAIPSWSITTITAIPYTVTTTGTSTLNESIATAPSPTTVTTTAASMGTNLEVTTAIPTPNTTITSTTSTEVTTTAATVSSTTASRNERSMISTTASTTEAATTISEPTIPFSIQATPPVAFAATSLPYVITTTTSLNATAATISTDPVGTDTSQKETDRTSIHKSSSIGSITKSTMFLEEVLLFWSCILDTAA